MSSNVWIDFPSAAITKEVDPGSTRQLLVLLGLQDLAHTRHLDGHVMCGVRLERQLEDCDVDLSVGLMFLWLVLRMSYNSMSHAGTLAKFLQFLNDFLTSMMQTWMNDAQSSVHPWHW